MSNPQEYHISQGDFKCEKRLKTGQNLSIAKSLVCVNGRPVKVFNYIGQHNQQQNFMEFLRENPKEAKRYFKESAFPKTVHCSMCDDQFISDSLAMPYLNTNDITLEIYDQEPPVCRACLEGKNQEIKIISSIPERKTTDDVRKVEVYDWEPVEGAGHSERILIGVGFFHQFGTSFMEFDEGPGNYSTAIVEMPDGTIKNPAIEDIKFIEPLE